MVRRHSSRSSCTFVAAANASSRFSAAGSAAAAPAITSTCAVDNTPPRNASAIRGSPATCFEVSNDRRASLVVVPPSFARCSAADRAPASFHVPASSTRAASNIFAFAASRSMQSNAFHNPDASHNGTSFGSSASTNTREVAFALAHRDPTNSIPPHVIRDCHTMIMTGGCDN